jgi:hypothetical protein
MRRTVVLAGAALAAAVLAALALRGQSGERMPASASASAAANVASPAPMPPTAQALAAAVASAAAPAASTPVVARIDPRVPAIDPPDAEPAPAQPWEIADPALYKAREQRLVQATNERFVQAADARLPPLLAALDDLRARNASPADIARAEDKIRHLQAVRDALVRGQPLVRDGRPADQFQAGGAAASGAAP